MFTISDEELLEETARQVREHDAPVQKPYQPSDEVMRLTNAIDRALERIESPEETIRLILQGAGARYACCPVVLPPEQAETPDEISWDRIRRGISYITLSEHNSVSVVF